MNLPLAAAEVLALKDFSNNDLAALNLALTGFGRVHASNHAYKLAVEKQLIKDSGYAWDLETLLASLDYVIQQRTVAEMS